MPDPNHATKPEVLPAVRHGRKVTAEIPDRLQHEGRRPAPYRGRESTRGATTVGGCALLLRPRPQKAAGRTHPAVVEGRLSQQTRQPARPGAAHQATDGKD